MMSDTPIREWGEWTDLTPQERALLTTRGVDAIFDPKLREGIVSIFEDVREHGDAAVIRALKTFDHCDITPGGLRVSEEEIDAACAQVDDALLAAIRDSIAHLRRFNEHLVQHSSWSFETDPGLTVGEKITPIASVGLFAPSGKGSFPSVVTQLGTPAVVAGVPEIVLVIPPVPGRGGEVDPACLVAAKELGITQVFRVNGPAGIAALTFGTESIPKVVKLCGPGSPPVACAQVEAQRYGTTGVLLLGPSESLIIADDAADVHFLAADLLNEAEHGPDSTSVLVTDSQGLIDALQTEVATQLAKLPEPRRTYAAASLGTNGGAVLVKDLEEATDVANEFAPEHMQIVTRDDDAVLARMRNAGEILLGASTTISMANYVIGCPAALPTSGYATVGSGITADAFRKRTAVARATPEALRRVAPTVVAYADHEGFPAHKASLEARLAAH